MSNIFGEVIYSYTREQAIEDGVLVDLKTQFPSATVFYKYPVACTAAVWNLIEEAVEGVNSGNSFDGVIFDIVNMTARFPTRRIGADTVIGRVIITGAKSFAPDSKADGMPHYDFKVVCGPGDNMEPVITIMRPNES